MTDEELQDFLGIRGKIGATEYVAHLTPVTRETYERMAQVETELHELMALYDKGRGHRVMVSADLAEGRKQTAIRRSIRG